jgi:hypothetical protein
MLKSLIHKINALFVLHILTLNFLYPHKFSDLLTPLRPIDLYPYNITKEINQVVQANNLELILTGLTITLLLYFVKIKFTHFDV